MTIGRRAPPKAFAGLPPSWEPSLYPRASKDAAVIIRLGLGSYVAQASALDPNESGQVLIEVYILP